jgi:outer membrane receptor protein involved in Fe transport
VASNVNDELSPQAFNDRLLLEQRTAGITLQAVVTRKGAALSHELTLGASLQGASADFVQERQEAAFSADRQAIGLGPFNALNDIGAQHSYRSVYVIEQLAPSPAWTFTFSGRYNFAAVHLRDRSGTRPPLEGDHDFRRFTPALGATWNPHRSLTWFASLSEGMRVPAPAELACADPAAPCTLPNQFLADPALKPVLARTVEAGLRARAWRELAFSASVYRSVLHDDIQFVSSGSAVNAGFFQNTGSTLRQGVDFTVASRTERLSLTAAYSYIRAEYLTAFRMRSPNNSSRDAADEITVERGSVIPGIPRSLVKLLVDWAATARTSLGFGWAWFDRQYARGDENNQDANGPLPAYSVAQAFARYKLERDWQFSVKLDNLFNQRYASFGILGRNFFTGPGNTYDAARATPEQFVTPGAPRSLWLAAQYAPR